MRNFVYLFYLHISSLFCVKGAYVEVTGKFGNKFKCMCYSKLFPDLLVIDEFFCGNLSMSYN